MDVGQPKDFLAGTCLYLSHLTSQHSPLLTDPSQNKWVYGGNVMVDPVSRALQSTEEALTLFDSLRKSTPQPSSAPMSLLVPTRRLGLVSVSSDV